ncbi:MAG: nicotinamide-nucleotide amidohydrolase family protein [Microbacterium sp.]|uniref:CinA family protein n=1 Tax=Microbacterium sp. TaxID=51671 RepID=UPI0039E3CF13
MSTVSAELPDDVEATALSARSSEPERLVACLSELHWTVGVAESLTGGLVVSALVDVPGASAVLRGGVVAYASDVKHSVLGVDASLLRAHGAVHPLVAAQMAEGVRRVLSDGQRRCDLGVATTGIAGPDSPDGQPVGTVHVAVATPLGARVETLALAGGREAIRAEAARAAIRLALEAL